MNRTHFTVSTSIRLDIYFTKPCNDSKIFLFFLDGFIYLNELSLFKPIYFFILGSSEN